MGAETKRGSFPGGAAGTALKDVIPGFDYALIGDGSGINECGAWAVTMFDLSTGESELFCGSVSHTTNNIMELQGYLVVLGELHRRGVRGPKVLIVSDSKVTVKCGSDEWRRKSNKQWWSAFDQATVQLAADVRFHHIRRNSFHEAEEADRMAGELRVQMEDFLQSELDKDS